MVAAEMGSMQALCTNSVMAILTERARELLTATNVAFLAELMEDGSPHVSPVWIDVVGDLVLGEHGEETAEGGEHAPRPARGDLHLAGRRPVHARGPPRARRRDPRGDAAVADIDRLGRKYRGWDRYPLGEGEQRVSYLIEPTVCT